MIKIFVQAAVLVAAGLALGGCPLEQAKTAAPEIKRMLGSFGEVVALDEANQLIITDTVGNLRSIIEILDRITSAEG